MKIGELFGDNVEDITMSEEDKKEYNDWLEKLKYVVNKLNLSDISIGNKTSAKACFDSAEIALKALKEITLK